MRHRPLSISLLCLLCWCGMSCSLRPVAVRHMENFALRNVLVRPEVTFDLVLYNPNKVGVTLTGVESEVSVGDQLLAGVSLHAPTRMPARSEIRIPFRAVPDLGRVTKMLLSGSRPDEATSTGELRVRKFIFSKRIRFRETYRL